MHIAMIISNPFPPEEGIGHYTYNLSKKLMERGHEVTIFTRGNHLKNENLNYDGIKVFKLKFIPIYPFHVHLHGYFMKKFISSYQDDFDLIHIHSPLSPVLDLTIPIVGTIHTSLIEDIKHFQGSGLKKMLINLTTHSTGKLLTQKLIDKSNIITTVSNAVREELIKYYNVNNPLVVANGVDELKFYPNNYKEKKKDYILYVGRLDYRKGIYDLIKGFSKLNEDFKLLIAGKGPLEKNIRKFILKNSINNIKLLGQVSGKKLIKLYQSASIFVFPSHYEGLPTVLLEAMACGLPIITTNIPSHQDLIKDYWNGLLVEKGSPEEIVKKIKILSNDQILKDKLGKNARITIEKKFTWDIISEKFENIYFETVNLR